MDSLPASCSYTLDSLPDYCDESPDVGLATQRKPDKDMLQEVTTWMLCNLPCRITIEQLRDAFDSTGFRGTYDFVYMPSRTGTKRSKKDTSNLGYAFVNFRKTHDATRFSFVFTGYHFNEAHSPKKVTLKPALCQGYSANVALLNSTKKHHPCMNVDFFIERQ
jgi:hypothetical protein